MTPAGASGKDLNGTLGEALGQLERVRAELQRVQEQHVPYEELSGIIGEFDRAKTRLGLGLYGVSLALDPKYIADVRQDQVRMGNGQSFDDEITQAEFVEWCREFTGQ